MARGATTADTTTAVAASDITQANGRSSIRGVSHVPDRHPDDLLTASDKAARVTVSEPGGNRAAAIAAEEGQGLLDSAAKEAQGPLDIAAAARREGSDCQSHALLHELDQRSGHRRPPQTQTPAPQDPSAAPAPMANELLVFEDRSAVRPVHVGCACAAAGVVWSVLQSRR